MIRAVHTVLYAEDAEAARAFFRDVLGFPSVDGGQGWLIFALPPSELGIHPGESDGGSSELYLMCSDVEQTVRELKGKGVEFVSSVADEGWGLVTRLVVPGFGEVGLYQPRHASPLAEFADSA